MATTTVGSLKRVGNRNFSKSQDEPSKLVALSFPKNLGTK